MRRKLPGVAIAVSLAIHGVLFTAFLTLPYLLAEKNFPGPGDDVEVWLTAPTGSVGADYQHGVPTPRKPTAERRTRSTAAEGRQEKNEAMAIRKAQEGSERQETAESELSPDAGGSGGLGGPGVGQGRGGDPLLAKIWSKINASKYYPASARRAGLMGAPRVTFSIASDGNIAWVKLAQSCGKKILDEAALETVRRAAPLPFYPKPITVAVKYSLMN
jgi:protein TonB